MTSKEEPQLTDADKLNRERIILEGFPALNEFLLKVSRPSENQNTTDNEATAIETLYTLIEYLSKFDSYSPELLSCINNFGPLLAKIFLQPRFETPYDLVRTFVQMLIHKALLPTSFNDQLKNRLNEDEKATLEICISILQDELFNHYPNFIDDESNKEFSVRLENHYIKLLKHVSWLIDTVFESIQYDTLIHQEAIARFITLVSSVYTHSLRYCHYLNDPPTQRLMEKIYGYIIDNGSKHLDTIAVKWVIDINMNGPLKPTNGNRKLSLFSLADFLILLERQVLVSDGELSNIQLLILNNVEKLKAYFLMVAGQGQIDVILPILVELYYKFAYCSGNLARDLLRNHLSQFGFSQDESWNLILSWISSHNWEELETYPWNRQTKMLEKYRGEFNTINIVHLISPASPARLHREYGITHFRRYPTDLLIKQAVRESPDITRVDRPRVLVASSIGDHNFALDALRRQLNNLGIVIENELDFYIVESNDPKKLGEEISRLKSRYGKFFLLLLSGHGSELAIDICYHWKAGTQLTIRDAFLGIVRDPKCFFRRGGMIILNSCSTALTRKTASDESKYSDLPNDIEHIAGALASSFGVKVVGPDEPAKIEKFEVIGYSADGLPRIKVIYGSKLRNEFPGISVPAPKKNKAVSTRV